MSQSQKIFRYRRQKKRQINFVFKDLFSLKINAKNGRFFASHQNQLLYIYILAVYTCFELHHTWDSHPVKQVSIVMDYVIVVSRSTRMGYECFGIFAFDVAAVEVAAVTTARHMGQYI